LDEEAKKGDGHRGSNRENSDSIRRTEIAKRVENKRREVEAMENQQQTEQLDVEILIRTYQARLSKTENDLIVTQARLEQKAIEANSYRERLIELEQKFEKLDKQTESPSEAE